MVTWHLKGLELAAMPRGNSTVAKSIHKGTYQSKSTVCVQIPDLLLPGLCELGQVTLISPYLSFLICEIRI